jgi:diguanylate cyclase (GGDEF)-like protein/PAS domain S-box-containing protein
VSMADTERANPAAVTQAPDLRNIAPVGYFMLDGTGLIREVNPIAAALLGLDRGALLGRPFGDFVRTEDLDRYTRVCQLLKDGCGPQSCELRVVPQSKPPFWAHLIASTTLDADGAPIVMLLLSDITEHRRNAEEIYRLAYYDPLTGLPNRRLLLDRLHQVKLTTTRSGQHGALMFMDLDHFKLVNDRLGHDMGDLLLQQVGERLKSCLREGDSVARLGGDEFVLLLAALSGNGAEAASQAEVIAQKLLAALAQPYQLQGQVHSGTASLGIVVFKDGKGDAEILLKNADAAMYQAKHAGRNQARFYDPAMQAAVAARADLEQDMRQGLLRHEFELHYQLQVDKTGAPLGAEALLRWNHPRQGLLAPASFISLAEESGLILSLSQWVLETACAQLESWSRQRGNALCAIAINVSTFQFAQADFVAAVTSALERSGANPKLFKLEVTENMLTGKGTDLAAKMTALKALGVRFELDDFGTGYSSLSHLKRLPLDQLKMDQSFVKDVMTNDADAVIARAIVALGHSLGLKVIAEGVESAAQHEFLADIGCDAFQGYHFGHPMPAAEFSQLISTLFA